MECSGCLEQFVRSSLIASGELIKCVDANLISTTSIQMWKPADITAIPTNQDVINATSAIIELEGELEEARVTLKQAQLRVANLEKDLRLRRAWLSPVRRLNFDALSRIFEFVGEDDWTAPTRLGAVSRPWRDCVLGTPRAWSFFDLKVYRNPKMVELCLERSRPLLLHMGLSRHPMYTTVVSMSDRLQCLSIHRFPLDFGNIVFPHIKKLFIRSSEHKMRPSWITTARFPALRHLNSRAIFDLEYDYRSYQDLQFRLQVAPLHTLAIVVDKYWAWFAILRSCQDTLVSLKLEVSRETIDRRTCHSLTLPALACLDIGGRKIAPNTWPLQLKTPILESYIERVAQLQANEVLHADLETVTHMRISQLTVLSHAISVRRIQLLNGEYQIYPLLTRLKSDSSFCPHLEAVEVPLSPKFSLDEGELAMRLGEVAESRSRLVEVVNVDSGPLPKEVNISVSLLAQSPRESGVNTLLVWKGYAMQLNQNRRSENGKGYEWAYDRLHPGRTLVRPLEAFRDTL